MMSQSNSDQNPWIIQFSNPAASAEKGGIFLVGGKGANLARLSQAGFNVPPGFLVSTQAYRDFVAANRLEVEIAAALPAQENPDPAALEAASERIRALFSAGKMPETVANALVAAYYQMYGGKVAVRSSATAEDLPDMSFAGQQDTYLNVLGSAHLQSAVTACWGSLWTARAIGYRIRNHVSNHGVALAVVVQRMVESQASGVLFTANPLTGLRSEMVVDATLGLGEALVSGRVEPDHYVVDSGRMDIVSKKLGAKALAILPVSSGGTTEVNQPRPDVQALPDQQILALASLGQKVAERYHAPQDIEWAWASDKLYLLQSRAITSLYPTPDGIPPEPLRVFFSFGAVQGMLDPMTPLGMAMIKELFAVGQGLVGIHSTAKTQTILYPAGERLWGNITTLLRNTTGRQAVLDAMNFVEPSTRQAILQVIDDPRLKPEREGVRFKAKRQIARLLIPVAANAVLNLLSPNLRREMIVNRGERMLDVLRARFAAVSGTPHERLAKQVDIVRSVARTYLPGTFRLFVSGVAAGMASFNWLNMLANRLPDGSQAVTGASQAGDGHWSDLVLETVRGVPHNPTTQMDLALWAAAQAIRRDPAALQEFQNNATGALARRYHSGEMAAAARQVVGAFMDKYGMRGLGEIDLGRERWHEDPTHVLDTLKGYLQIYDREQAPDVVFARGAEAGEAAVARLAAALRHTRRGWFKARLARFAASRARALIGIRESPKFFVVRMFGIVRCELLATGADLVKAGELTQAEDVFYLTFSELKHLAAGEAQDWQALIASRREAYRRETLRRQVPRLLLSDGRAFYEGLRSEAQLEDGGEARDHALTGSPVSPGSVEGRVRVVLDPRHAQLQAGEILVCPGTDPSWTPLFLSAGGLVMEVGGMMTHGAVVAREYGIPAVVGVDRATQRLVTGQRIRLNGSTGAINLLDTESV